MKKLHSIFCFLFLFHGLYAQKGGIVSNVQILVSPEQDKVTISYDLGRSPGNNQIAISAEIRMRGNLLNTKGLSGDIGSPVIPGLGKKIIWDALQDVDELSEELNIKVNAHELPKTAGRKVINILPAYAGLGGVALTGLGLASAGIKVEEDAQNLYKTYRDNINPNDPVYQQMSREEHYEEANQKHKQAQLLAIAGGTTLAVGGFIMISRLIKIKKYNKQTSGHSALPPRLQLSVPPIGSTHGQRTGISLIYNF